MLALRTQSNRKASDVVNLAYYVVAASWVRKALPILDRKTDNYGDNWREEVGSIENADLLVFENAVSEDEEDDDRNQKDAVQQLESGFDRKTKVSKTTMDVAMVRHHQRKAHLRPGLVHGQDYFLLGSNAWLLVKSKFGYDHEIGRPCVFEGDRAIAVVVYEATTDGVPPAQGNRVLIPFSGRFEYDLSAAAAAANGGPNRAEAGLAANPAKLHPGSVSEDEDGENADAVRVWSSPEFCCGATS